MSDSGTGLPPGTVYASFWVRLGATVLDGLLLAVIGWIIPGESWQLESLVQAVYSISFLALKGATPGKMALGLKVVSVDGEPLSWGKAIIRYVASIVSGLILFIGYIMIAFDDQKRGLHDRIAGTYVIKA